MRMRMGVSVCMGVRMRMGVRMSFWSTHCRRSAYALSSVAAPNLGVLVDHEQLALVGKALANRERDILRFCCFHGLPVSAIFVQFHEMSF